MGEHDAPASWWERWQQEEPLRLWLWSVAGAVLLGGVATGLWTDTWALAAGGVIGAVLMTGGTALARRQAWAPATVEWALNEQHAKSYRQGWQAGTAAAMEEQNQRTLTNAETRELAAVRPPPRRCRYVESGRRCVRSEHTGSEHRLEEARPRE